VSTATISAAPAAPLPSAWEDCVDIFYAPGEVFARRRDGRFALALLVFTVLMTLLFFLSQRALAPIFDAQFADAMAKAGDGSSAWGRDRLEWLRVVSDRIGVLSFGIGLPLGTFALAMVVLAVARLAEIPLGPGGAVVAAVFSQYPRLIELAAGVAQGIILPPERLTSFYSISFSLARVLEPTGAPPLALAFAARVDVFTLWATLLLVISLRRLAGASAREAWFVAGILWLLGVLPVLLRS